MFSFFSKDNAFGVDIGTQSIKIAEIKEHKDKVELENYAIFSSEIGEIIQEQGEHTMAASTIAETVQRMLGEADMSMNEVFFALPSFFTFSSVITVPTMSEEELAEAVPLQARQHVPVPMDSVQVNWINLGKHAKEEKLNVLIIAIPNSVVAKYQNVAHQLDVEINGFELDIFSRLRSLSLPDKHTCIVDIGSRSTSVSIVDDEQNLRMIRAFDVGGNQITDRLSNALEISMERAELLKVENGLTGDPGVASVIDKVLGKFFRKEVGNMIQEYADMMHAPVAQIELAGGISQMKGINNFVEDTLQRSQSRQDLTIREARPTSELAVPEELREVFFEDVWHDLSLAIGIALRKYV